MLGLVIFQILFDAILIFTILFLFHFSVQKIHSKKEEADLLKNAQALEIRENLQEMLEALKILGKEISDDIQEKIKLTDEKANKFKGLLLKLERDLARVSILEEKIEKKKNSLEENRDIQAALLEKETVIFSDLVKNVPKNDSASPAIKKSYKGVKRVTDNFLNNEREIVAVSPELVGKIYKLSDEAYKLNAIVRETNLTPAEVQLILNLRANRLTTDN